MTELTRNWRLLRCDAADGARNMAFDRALLDVMEADLTAGLTPRPILRLYSWSPPTVSIGRHQELEAACDLPACRAAGVDVVQRPTGGRGVLHEHELTFAVVAPARGPFAGTGVSRASAAIASALVRGLSRLGVPVNAARGAPPSDPRQRRGACFSSTSRQEIVVEGRKLCGSAQFRGRQALLQHGSLPLRFDVERQARVLGAPAELLRAKALGLADCLEQEPTVEDVRLALQAGFSEELDLELGADAPREAESERLAELEHALRADARRFRSASEQPCRA